MSWRAKSSLCQQPFKSIQKSGRINLKNGLFPVLDQFRALHESCIADQSCCNFFLFPQNSCHLMTDLMINFACQSRDEFCACTIENLNSCRQGLLFTCQLTLRKCSLCSQEGTRLKLPLMGEIDVLSLKVRQSNIMCESWPGIQ